MVNIERVSYNYTDGKAVINDISATLDDGRIYGLLGKNGAGKTTLMKLVSGMVFPKQGRITIDGTDVSARNIKTMRETFFMPSEFKFSDMSMEKFVRLYSGFYPSFSREILEDCLQETGVERIIRTAALERLSLGEKHKVMTAFAIASGTRLLLMDEPAGGMDIPTRATFRKLLLRHLRNDQTVVISTHHAAEFTNILSDVIILGHNGEMAFAGRTEDICDRYVFGIYPSDSGALYAEPCAGGYHAVRERGLEGPSEIDLEILFNAAVSGKLGNS